jgi:hypothetical protein
MILFCFFAFLLRGVAIVIKLILILFVNIILEYELFWMPLVVVISIGTLFILAIYLYYLSGKEADRLALFGQICTDIYSYPLL